ncbi:MAG TPA: hypothetical protein VGG74_07610 [Kofleriaceae bacterium]
MLIPPDFHADNFEYAHRSTGAASIASERLANRLQAIIAPCLHASKEPVRELERIVAELRVLGHPLELDEDDRDWTIYADRPHRNLAVWVHWNDTGRTSVAQTEVLWQHM